MPLDSRLTRAKGLLQHSFNMQHMLILKRHSSGTSYSILFPPDCRACVPFTELALQEEDGLDGQQGARLVYRQAGPVGTVAAGLASAASTAHEW